jgi:hypothetical protein
MLSAKLLRRRATDDGPQQCRHLWGEDRIARLDGVFAIA